MVSKRKSVNGDEAGPSKKRGRAEPKTKTPDNNTLPAQSVNGDEAGPSKKRGRAEPKTKSPDNNTLPAQSVNGDEAGPSKKRGRAEKKTKSPDNNTLPAQSPLKKKKLTKKAKNTKEIQEKSQSDHEDEINKIENEPKDVDITVHIKKSENSDLPDWPAEHMSELVRRIETFLPDSDNLSYKSRAEKLNWNDIAFDNYSGAECRVMWDSIQKRLRRFRFLRELLDDAKSWISKPWTNFYRGSKTNRHPDLPKRPLSTYMIFYLKKKDKVLQENPGLEMTGLSKYIAEMYKKISPKTKEKYNELAVEQRRVYETKLEEFYRLHPDLAPNNNNKVKSLAQTNDHIPKKPPTPFKLFCEDKMKTCKTEVGFDKALFSEKCKEQWRSMSDKKKVFWINWTLDKETKYQEEMKKYIAENPKYVPSTVKSILTKEERTICERMAGKPEKPPNSAYSLFSRVMLASEEVKSVSPKERMIVIAQLWKNCAEAEKKEYVDRVKHMLEVYKLQYAEYLESLSEDKRQEELLNNQPKKKTKAKKVTNNLTSNDATPAKRTKNSRTKSPKKKTEKMDTKTVVKKENNLYAGEPEPPPATPYLMFAKTYQSSYPDRHDAQEAWKKMTEDQRNFHRSVLWDMKKVYIESYENFLKSLTPEELKEYSEWKKSAKLANQDSEASSDDSDSDSEECSSGSERDDGDDKSLKKEDHDDSDD